MRCIYYLALLFWFARLSAPAQDFQELQRKTTDFTLSNGMRFIVAERHDIPSIAIRVYVAAGAIYDPPGAAGLAQSFERIMLHGSESIGARDPAAEKKALDAAEEIRNQIDAERAKGQNAGETRLGAMRLELSRAAGEAKPLGDFMEVTHALQGAGITFSIHVGADSTLLDATVPSNRAELWFLIQSQELRAPVFRRFYDERDDMESTYRARVDAVPLNSLLLTLSAAAFTAHPYRNPVPGWPSDLAQLRLAQARQFFDRYWSPGNVAIAMAGDITAENARLLADRYFAPIPARPLPPPVSTRDPEQRGPRTVVMENSPQAWLAIGYKRPDEYDRDDPAFEIIRAVLTGRNGWLHKELVDDKRIAADVQVQSTFPAGRYPHLLLIAAPIAPGHTTGEAENAVTAVVAKLQAAPLDEAALQRARAMARGQILSRLSDNAGIASSLAIAAGEFGDWRKAFAIAEAVGKVTAQQVQVAALKYLTPSRRTSVHMDPPPPVVLPARGGSQ